MAKKDLLNAKMVKFNEFYTQLNDIELELKHYKEQFKEKVVFCNCDDPYESNFFKYFAINFNHLGLKKLIATCYDSSPVAYTQMNFFGENKLIANKSRKAYKIVITEVLDYNNDGAIDLSDVDYLLKNKNNTMALLKGNGDFRSKECIELLKQSDIVVTNPPFSLFREYIAQLIEYNKSFIIIGNPNAVSYKEVFSLIRDNKLWLGYKSMGTDMLFNVTAEYADILVKTKKEGSAYRYVNGKLLARAPAIWFTNLENSKRYENIVMYKKYDANYYRKFVNYDAINIDKVSEIPYDYYDYMGVPITFIDKYNPEQFEIIGLGISNSGLEIGVKPYLPEHKKYRKEIQHRGTADGDLYMLDEQGHPDVPYARVIIKRRTTNEN